MPTPSNAPSASIGPGAQQVQDAALFASLTERQEMPQTNQAIAGLSEEQLLEFQKVGVVAQVRLQIEASFKVAGAEGKAKLNPGFPQKLLKKVSIESNGVTGIISCSALALEARRRRIFRNPVKAVEEGPKAGEELEHGTEHKLKMSVVIPIAHDMLSLIGALLAQNEETGLSIALDWASEAEAFDSTKNKVEKFEGTVKWGTTVFSIGSTVIGNNRVTVLPDLSAFHGIVEKELKVKGTGEEPSYLTRTNGQLLCYGVRLQNGNSKEVAPKEWDSFAIEYGGNKDPRKWRPAAQLVEQNADDYDGDINVGELHTLYVDNEVDNPDRDMIFPEALTELMGVVGIPAGTALEANAAIITTQETLYPAA